MSTLRGGSSLVALLAAATLALGACGGDDGGNGSGTADAGSPDFTTNSGTGTTGTTERERTGTTEDRTTKTKKSGDGSGNGGSSKSGSGGNDDSGSKAQPAPQPGNVAKIAEKVCNSFLPKQISRDLANDKTKPEDVARDYSRGFPEKQRGRAYEGCLAGLKKR
jgi:hypothetical protein